MSASWQSLNPVMLDMLTRRMSWDECFTAHGREVCARLLRWCVRAEASTGLVLDWLGQGLLSAHRELRTVACEVLAECDFVQMSQVVINLKETHHKLPRSTRTAIVRQLRELECGRDVEEFAVLFREPLRHLYATLHVKPSALMQSHLFQTSPYTPSTHISLPERPLSWSVPLDAAPRTRAVVQVYVQWSKGVDAQMLEALGVWLCDMSRRDLFSCELYRLSGRVMRCHPAALSERGWQDAVAQCERYGEVPGEDSLYAFMRCAHEASPAPVRHIVWLCDATMWSEEQAMSWCERGLLMTEGDEQERLVSVVRWSSVEDILPRGVMRVSGRGCVWTCRDEMDMLCNMMAYMLM